MAKMYLFIIYWLLTVFSDLWSDRDIQNPFSENMTLIYIKKTRILNLTSSNVQIFVNS